MSGRKVLFSAQRNEGPFILEWVAYHKVIGFTDIVVVSNDCDDGSDDLLDRLQDQGLVTHIRQTVPPATAPQLAAEAAARKAQAFAPGDWVMWLDLDEYLAPPADRPGLDALIGAMGDADALSIAWRFFGDSGLATWPGRQISPRFRMAERRRRDRRPQVKTLFRYDERVARLDIHRPVLAEGVDAARYPWISSTGRPVAPEFYDATRGRPANRITDAIGYFRLGAVLHFSVRTPDRFAAKESRGDGYYALGSTAVVRDRAFYDKKNRNHVEEVGHLVFEAATVARMQAIMALPGIRDACDRIEGFRWQPL